MASIQITVEGVDSAVKALAEYDGKAHYKVDLAKRNTATAVAHRAYALAPVWDGELKSTIHADGDSAVATSDHAAPVEYGAGPHMPPVSAITPWALAHGISPWALAYAIRRRGTPAQPFMRPAAESERARYIERVAAALDEATL